MERRACWLVIVLAVICTGCGSTSFLEKRAQPRNPLDIPLKLSERDGPQPTERTEQLLRRYNLKGDVTPELLVQLQSEIAADPTPDKVYAFAELAYLTARQAAEEGDEAQAFEFYAAAVTNAYWYLFCPAFEITRTPFDPQFRRACDLYNSALEGTLRIANAQTGLKPGASQQVTMGDQTYHIDIVVRGKWHEADIERIEFVSDYDLRGLANRHHTYGLGVPLIAVRTTHEGMDPGEDYYPKGLSFPVTAFLRVKSDPHGDNRTTGQKRCVLELLDPVQSHHVLVDKTNVPLETDLTTPLAYFLDTPELRETREKIATLGLLFGDKAAEATGLYMLEPYDPNKIPVLMVHGLWSSPLTWMEMFNDLRSFPELRNRYQFWFYLYPTGQPFWVSANQLRQHLAEVRGKLDPYASNRQLEQMVLVGHSMGGLVSKMQTIESGNNFWKQVSDRPFEDLRASEQSLSQLQSTLFFRPNPSVRRVISIGTPHQGSDFANDYTRWLARKVINLPQYVVQTTQELILLNPGFFNNTELLTTTTSIDSLAKNSPVFDAIRESPKAPWVEYHNIVGVVSEDGFVGRLTGKGDGVVDYDSAHLEEARSEIVVEADHTQVHMHPLAILEVRRVLNEHFQAYLVEMQQRQQQVPGTVGPQYARPQPDTMQR